MQKTSVISNFYCLANKLALTGLRPVFFGPRTLERTWGNPSREEGFVLCSNRKFNTRAFTEFSINLHFIGDLEAKRKRLP